MPEETKTWVTSTMILFEAPTAADAQRQFNQFADLHNAGNCLLPGSDAIEIVEDNSGFELLDTEPT